ncbi:MAG: competence/damage-inducible protein A [Myxococcaceae bacterium]
METSVAAAVVIGNEVLNAQVVDENGAYLIQRLREHGIGLSSLSVVPDEVDAIVDAVLSARRRARWVFTSGGIGPTHDDVTVRAVALALGRRVVQLPEMLALLEAHYPDVHTPEAMRLTEAPEGTQLLHQEGSWYPVLVCEGVFLLPGIPPLFRRQLETVLKTLPVRTVFQRALYLVRGEAEIAGALDRVALQTPGVGIGSYPQYAAGTDYRVRITVEGLEKGAVDAAVARLQRELPPGAVLRVE